MKCSFVTTVFNEEENIKKLLDSLLYQSKMPDEIIIVDGKSKDKTLDLVDSYKNKFIKSHLRVFIKKGNRSIGRNFGIKKAKYEIVAISDAGCILEKHWFEKITKPFADKAVDVAAGFYKPITKNTFEKSLAAYTCLAEDKVNENFLPSSRSIAFRRKAWERVKGYPEELNTCEDLVFAKRLKLMGLKFEVVRDAVVLWPQRENIIDAAKQFFSYAQGDGQAFYIRAQTPLLFGRYLLGIILIIAAYLAGAPAIYYFLSILLLFYILWSIQKNYKYVNALPAVLYLPILQITSDIMVILGFITGFFKRIWGTKK